jgi:NAD(P)-dependent dehydrogenase (short-subunit alcohol dehydrogenase family)
MKQGRVVVITGAAGAMGAVLVERFLANEDTVIATDVNADALHQLDPGTIAGSRLITVAADICEEVDCRRLADVARKAAGRVDVLINCAGYFPFRPFEEMTSQEWRQVIDINLTGPFLMISAVLPLMKNRGWGRIINFGSASVFAGAPGQSHYVAAKAGVVGLSRSLARAVGGYGITVNVVTPGLTLSKAVRDHFPAELLAAQREARALPRDEEPGDVAGAVFFLASPDADFMSGQTVNVDGGKFMP